MTRTLNRALLLAIASGFLAVAAAAEHPPCPAGSAEKAFELQDDLASCVVGRAEGNPVTAGHGRYYNVYCPGRMSKSQAVSVAVALANDAPRVPGNPIPSEYSDQGLRARYAFEARAAGGDRDDTRGVRHWFHYACGHGGVATHLKLELASEAPSSRQVAERCSEVNRAGSVRPHGRVDVEYRCKLHLKPSNRRSSGTGPDCPGPDCSPPWVEEVAALKVQEDILGDAHDDSLRTCLLRSTDIQCAPCTSSDKLVVRLAFVPEGSRCPKGTARVVGSP